MPKKRKRFQFKFWLDWLKPTEQALAERLEDLRLARKLAPTIRNALRLFFDLSDGKTDVLKELFPWVLETRQDTPQAQQGSENGNNGDSGQDERIKALEATIASQQRTIDQLTIINQNPQYNAPTTTEPRKLTSGKPDLPSDLLEVTQAKADARNKSNWNFMIASALQVYGNFDSLPPEIIRYGVETKRIPADKLPKNLDKVRVPYLEKENEIKTLAGGDMSFTAPTFDDFESIEIGV